MIGLLSKDISKRFMAEPEQIKSSHCTGHYRALKHAISNLVMANFFLLDLWYCILIHKQLAKAYQWDQMLSLFICVWQWVLLLVEIFATFYVIGQKKQSRGIATSCKKLKFYIQMSIFTVSYFTWGEFCTHIYRNKYIQTIRKALVFIIANLPR